MLDDLKMIHNRDADDALGMAGRQWRQLLDDYAVPDGLDNGIANVLCAAGAEESLGLAVAKSWMQSTVPCEILDSFHLPAYAGRSSLCVIVSRGGDDRELLDLFELAWAREVKIVVVTAGGRLAELAAERNVTLVRLSATSKSHFAIWSAAKALVSVMHAAGLTGLPPGRVAAEADWLRDQLAQWSPDVATSRNRTKQLALELAGKSVVVYAGPRLGVIADMWKAGLNGVSHQLTWSVVHTAGSYHELAGWTKQPVLKPYAVVDIRSELDEPRVGSYFKALEKLLSGQRPAPHVVRPEGDTLLRQTLWAAAFGDFVAIYLALLNNVNPIVDPERSNKLQKELL